MNALQLRSWQFSHTKKLCNRISSSEVQFYRENGRFAFLNPPWGTYGDVQWSFNHLRLVGKHVGDFLLVLIDLFLLGRTAEALQAIICSKSAISLQRGPVDPKLQVEGVSPTYHSSSHKTRLIDLSQSIKICTDFSSVLSQCTHLTDGQTHGHTYIHT